MVVVMGHDTIDPQEEVEKKQPQAPVASPCTAQVGHIVVGNSQEEALFAQDMLALLMAISSKLQTPERYIQSREKANKDKLEAAIGLASDGEEGNQRAAALAGCSHEKRESHSHIATKLSWPMR